MLYLGTYGLTGGLKGRFMELAFPPSRDHPPSRPCSLHPRAARNTEKSSRARNAFVISLEPDENFIGSRRRQDSGCSAALEIIFNPRSILENTRQNVALLHKIDILSDCSDCSRYSIFFVASGFWYIFDIFYLQ